MSTLRPEIRQEAIAILLEVSGLKKWFEVKRSIVESLLSRKRLYVRAVDGISFNLEKGDVFCLAGESGSGKTTTGKLILRLIDPTEGSVIFDGLEVTKLSKNELRGLRRRMQPIFQDPYASLNPWMKIGEGVSHGLRIHKIGQNDEDRRQMTLEILDRVGLSPAQDFYNTYPHNLSGGQRQRAVIARAMILKPDFIVADEPVSMVDVSMRALILDLMKDFKQDFNLTYLFITHDLAVARYISNKIAIMYLGQIVEMGPVTDVFTQPQHPYTVALLSAIPIPDPKLKRERLIPKGEIPSPIFPPSGCRFHPRCPFAQAICTDKEPPLIEISKNHYSACHFSGIAKLDLPIQRVPGAN